MKIESTDKDVRTLFSSGYYKIPRFQRPYSWDKENIQEFWDDVIRDNPGDYFIGSMVVYSDGKQYFGVVDGQQRLTTITILLCALRNKLDTIGYSDLAHGVNGLIERKNIDNKPEFILSTESSYPYFQDHIQNFGKPEVSISPLKEEQNLQSGYDQLRKLLDDAVAGYLGDSSLTEVKRREAARNKLITIRDAVLDLKLIFIKLDSEDDAYFIFETLNTRGKDLSLADLVKNHLTKLLKSKSASVDQTKLNWEKVLETIQGSVFDLDVDTFIHHFWLSRFDYLPAKNLFKELKKNVTKENAKAFLNSLVIESNYYRSIHETAYGKWSKQEAVIEESLSALMLFRVRQQTPCVLALVREYRAGKIKKKHLEDALLAIEKFHFLFTAVTSQRSSGGISGMYAALGRRLFETTDVEAAVNVIRDLKTKCRERIPKLDEVKALMPSLIYTQEYTKNRKLIKYILVQLHKANLQAVTLDYDSMTIEHLVPQALIGKDGWDHDTIGQLGNLILVSEELNGKLQDKTFSEKKKLLLESGYKLEKEIVDAKVWTISDVENRTVKMAETAFNKVWKI